MKQNVFIRYACISLAIGIFGWFGWRFLHSGAVATHASEQPAGQNPDGVIELSSEKIAALQIATASVQPRQMQVVRTVPARVQYDDRKHIEVKAATAGTVVEVLVKPSDRVDPGQVLCTLSSPEVGDARSAVLQRQAELQIAEQQLKWIEQTNKGLKELTNDVTKRQPIDAIRKEYSDVVLGKSRNDLIPAYSRYLLAEGTLDRLNRLVESGSISDRALLDARRELESAEAALVSTTEQSLFDMRQKALLAKSDVDAARRRLLISQQQLCTLLGYEESLDRFDSATTNGAALSLVEIRAPFTGSVEQKMFSRSERVRLGETLFILADTTRLWVSADLREQEWAALTLEPGDPVQITVPALPNDEFAGTVYFSGRQVSPESNAVPLIAEVSNESGLLRPGLFAEMDLSLSEPRTSLTVPESAISVHERKPFVFVPETERSFRRVFVTTGIREGDWVEILSGLSAGDRVAVTGANKLKAELLLEREP